jgi:ribokinase
VGEDSFGRALIENLSQQGIHTENVELVANASTGIASITLANSDNSIIVIPGANNHVTPEMIDRSEALIANSSMLLLQLEIPLESVIRAVEMAKKYNVKVILNPAPIQKLPKELLEMVDYLTPNEHEQELLFASLKGTEQELNKLKEKCIVTKGSKGVEIYKNGEIMIPSYQVEAVDTTGAGDSFNGALGFALCEGFELTDACRLAVAVGAISVTKLGAQAGMPTRNEVEEFLRIQNER